MSTISESADLSLPTLLHDVANWAHFPTDPNAANRAGSGLNQLYDAATRSGRTAAVRGAVITALLIFVPLIAVLIAATMVIR
ncbi:hypothetical protein [Gordonia alkaliphila]|uniref:hypothetical protein n=1 Tax=Gordonia alkaliphila TaxID=1053547 RepID=UPI0031EBFE88